MSDLVLSVEKRILLIRGHRVLIDADLAELYGVTTKRLNEQIKRNIHRFPSDFMFQFTVHEKNKVVANCDHLKKLKFSTSLPYAFTEHGVVMAANLLSSEKAIETSVYIVRAFVKMKQTFNINRKLAEKLTDLESRIEGHDKTIKILFQTLHKLLQPVLPIKSKKIGLK